MKELTYQDRQRFPYDDVTAELKALGIPTDYPTAQVFSNEEIAEAVGKLSDSDRCDDVATLANGEYSGEVLAAFAALARALKSTITLSSYSMKIIKEASPEKQRERAVSNLASNLQQERRDRGIRSLMAKADAE